MKKEIARRDYKTLFLITSVLAIALLSIGFASAKSITMTITEVELNPSGDDAGNEWAELELLGDDVINLDGFYIENKDQDIYNLSGNVSEGYLVIFFPGQWLDNTNERVYLKFGANETIDETPIFEDEENDNRTWSLCADGWEFVAGTPNGANDCADDLGPYDISDLLALLAEYGCTEDCTWDLDGDGDVDEDDLTRLLENWGGQTEEANSDTNDDGIVSLEDLEVAIEDFACEGSCDGDANNDDRVDKTDLELIIHTLAEENPEELYSFGGDTGEDLIVDIALLLDALTVFGDCSSEGAVDCGLFDFDGDGDVDNDDLALLLLFWGEPYDSILGLTLIDPTGTYDVQQNLPLNYIVAGVGEFACAYNVTTADEETLIIGQTLIANCSSITFSVESDGDYKLFMFVNNTANTRISKNNTFSVDTTDFGTTDSGGGGGGSSSSSGGGSDGSCLTGYVCAPWSVECVDGKQTRLCKKAEAHCLAVGDIPETMRDCVDEQLFTEVSTEEPRPLFARITGSVIGENGRPTTFGILLFVLLVLAAYFVTEVMRHSTMPNEGNPEKQQKKEKTPAKEKTAGTQGLAENKAGKKALTRTKAKK